MLKQEKKLDQTILQKTVETYGCATNITCKAFSINGQKVAEFCQNSEGEPSFCKLIHQFEQGVTDCRQSYIYGGLEAEKLGDAYIYFCPYGLVNWAVPLFEKNEMTYFLTGGPVLMHQVDELLIQDIIKENPLLKSRFQEMGELLSEIPVVNTVKVTCLSELLLQVARSLMLSDASKLEKNKEYNEVNARIAETIHSLKNGEKNQEELYPFDKENDLISKVRLGDKQGAREVLNEILGFIYFQSGSKFKIVKSKSIELMVVLARAAIGVGADLEIIFGLEYAYLEYVNGVKDINKLSEWLTKILDRFIECTFSFKNVKNKDIIFKAMSYIRENYNQNVALADVASEVGLSPTYFSKLFKDEMDMTYTDYLNKVRIEEGKKLLEEGLTLVEIAQMVGFNDQSYFSKVFKKYEGISPGKWNNDEMANSSLQV